MSISQLGIFSNLCKLILWETDKGMKTIYDRQYRLLVGLLRSARKDARVTQSELANRLGRDQTYVSKIERFERRADVIEVRAICRALEIDFVEFVKTFEQALNEGVEKTRGS